MKNLRKIVKIVVFPFIISSTIFTSACVDTKIEDNRTRAIVFVGSSVVYGANSGGHSFVDEIIENDGYYVVKLAVSGTSLATVPYGSPHHGNTYTERFDNYIEQQHQATKDDLDYIIDRVIVQLSTNDAGQSLPLGEVTKTNDELLDVSTTLGAIEYFIQTSLNKLNCGITFLSSPQYGQKGDSYRDNYAAIINAFNKQILPKYAQKDVDIIDLWNDKDFNNITSSQREKWMADIVHPTLAGYVEWWYPKISEHLKKVVK